MSDLVSLIKDLPPVCAVWSAYGHRFMSTGHYPEDRPNDSYESCLTCGAEYTLVNLGGMNGEYVAHSGDPMECSGRTDLQHGIERHCDADNGRGCRASIEDGPCEHTDFECNCNLCD